MALPPPQGSRYRRYWGRYNRPYNGFGCLYTILLIVAIYFIVTLLFD